MSVATAQLTDEQMITIGSVRGSANLFIESIFNIKQDMLHRIVQHYLDVCEDPVCILPRFHGKTVQSAGRCALDIAEDPTVRIKYIQQGDDEAMKTSRMVRNIVRSEAYRAIFPEVRMDKEDRAEGQWSVIHNAIQRDPTFEGKGIFGRAGGRADKLIGDDICDLKNSVQSAVEREKVKESWKNNWLPFRDFTKSKRPQTRIFATPWHVDDLICELMESARRRGELLFRPVRNFQSPWSIFAVEELKRMREDMGPIAFARAMELTPVSDEDIVFPAEWLHRAFYTEDGARSMTEWQRKNGYHIAAFDCAYSDKRQGEKKRGDPDFSVCLIGWASNDGHLWIKKMVRVRALFTSFRDMSLRICNEYNVQRGKVESNGPQLAIAQDLQSHSDFPIEFEDRCTDKIVRATERQSFVEKGCFHILAEEDNLGELRAVDELKPLYDEMTMFPVAGHDDTVDGALDLMSMVRSIAGTGLGRKKVRVHPRSDGEAFFGMTG